MSAKWKVGVIGGGSVAQVVHLPGYAMTKGVQLVADCDPDPKRRAEVEAGHPCIRTYADYRKMLASDQFDMISVCTPNCFHAEHAIAALEHGANVLLEKPAALSMKEIAAIKKAVQRSGKQLMVGFSHRFKRGNQRIRQLLADGAIGEPFMYRIRMAHAGPYPGWAKNDWFYKPQLAGGGALLDIGIHAIDLALWHMGPVKSVKAISRTLRKKIKVDDNTVLLLEFASGKALGYLEASWTSPSGFTGLEIMGDRGSIVEDYAGVVKLTTGTITPNMKTRPKLKTTVVDKDPNHGGWSTEITEVVKLLRKGSNGDSGIDAGGAALAVALAGYESSRAGKQIEVAKVR